MINLFVTFCTVYHLTLNLYRPLSFVRAHLLHRLWSTYTERYLLYLQYIAEGKSDKEQKYPWIEFLYCTQNKTHDDTTHLYDKEASKRHDRLHFIQSNSTVRYVDCEGEKKKKERKKKKTLPKLQHREQCTIICRSNKEGSFHHELLQISL